MTADSDGHSAVWGVAMPPLNPTVEPEVGTLLGGTRAVFDRLDDHSDLELAERLIAYRETADSVVDRLVSQGAVAVGLACTGSSYDIGLDGDAIWRARLAERAGCVVHSAASATFDLLSELGAKAIVLVSPYPGWLTDACVGFWSGTRFEVVHVEPINNQDVIYETNSRMVATALFNAHTHAVQSQRPAAVVVAGTGAPTLAAITEYPATSIPIISSNLALAWRLHRSAPLDFAAPLQKIIESWSVERPPRIKP